MTCSGEGVPILGVIRHIQEGINYPDSIEIGTPGKGGTLKIFFDADKEEEAERRIRAGFALRTIAQQLQGKWEEKS
jgi:hypothetical protein